MLDLILTALTPSMTCNFTFLTPTSAFIFSDVHLVVDEYSLACSLRTFSFQDLVTTPTLCVEANMLVNKWPKKGYHVRI